MQAALATEKDRTWPQKLYRLFHIGNKINTRQHNKSVFSQVGRAAVLP